MVSRSKCLQRNRFYLESLWLALEACSGLKSTICPFLFVINCPYSCDNQFLTYMAPLNYHQASQTVSMFIQTHVKAFQTTGMNVSSSHSTSFNQLVDLLLWIWVLSLSILHGWNITSSSSSPVFQSGSTQRLWEHQPISKWNNSHKSLHNKPLCAWALSSP